MKLIQQSLLFFQAGNSDKVYEVDLCEVGPGEYIVNFRYGRRGANLTEGTKTVFPVPLDKAQKEFDKLVNSKKSKGYQDLPGGSAANTTAKDAGSAKTGVSMPEKVLEYLEAAAQGRYDEAQWKLSRVIWRAGELRLKEAAELLHRIPDRSGDSMFNYCLAWALGRCGDADSVPRLQEMLELKERNTSRIVEEGLLRLGDDQLRKKVVDQALDQLPERLREAVRQQNLPAIEVALSELTSQYNNAHQDFLYNLYRAESELKFLRPALLQVLATVKFQPPFFRSIRYIYKTAEFRDDEEVLGLLSVRMEKGRHFFKKPNWLSIWIGGKRVEVAEELAKPDSKLAYSDRTRTYLLQRSRRALDNLARTGGAYTRLARYVLLQYKDGEGLPEAQETFYKYEYVNRSWTSRSVTKYYPAMGNFGLLFHILYANSLRYKPGSRGGRWTYRPPLKPGEPFPDRREEAYPALWDEAPEDLVALLIESRCGIVVEFAAKAFQANPRRADHITIQLILGLLDSPYPTSNQLGLALAREAYDPSSPDTRLLQGLLDCASEEARQLGMQWAAEAKSQLLGDPDFLKALLLTRHPDVRKWAGTQVKSTYVSDTVAQKVLDEVVALLLQRKTDAEGEEAWAAEVVDQLQLLFPDSLRKVKEDVIVALTAHPWESMQLLGGRILLRYFEPKEKIPEAALESLLNSEWAPVRGLGVEVFGQLPDSVLRARKDIVVGFCISRHAEIRAQAGPLVAKLVRADHDFARGLVELFVPALWRKEQYEGVHDDLLKLAREVLQDHLADLPPGHTWKLIDSEYRAAHELGHLLLSKYTDPEALPLARIVKLGSHELLALRRYGWDYFSANVSRIKYEREEAVKLLDASWDDSRKFAIGYFGEKFTQDDWTPELLVSICDSTREELQQFGRQMITRFFREEDGDQYLLKLSQHPKAELQLFVTNYLERFAAGNVERIKGLDFYFHAVLSQVNKGRVAKERVFGFLHREAMANVEVARYVIPLLNRIALTISRKDKAQCIRILTDLRYRYPQLDSPITLQSFTTL